RQPGAIVGCKETRHRRRLDRPPRTAPMLNERCIREHAVADCRARRRGGARYPLKHTPAGLRSALNIPGSAVPALYQREGVAVTVEASHRDAYTLGHTRHRQETAVMRMRNRLGVLD